MSNITQGVKDFLKGSHKPDSTEVSAPVPTILPHLLPPAMADNQVCSEVAPEVTQEAIKPKEHTETAEAIDRERHIHHHQHRVQPIEHQQTLDTKHVQSVAAPVVREHKEDMLPEHQKKLHEQRTQHQDSKEVHETERTGAHIGTHVNQHEHHHIHETG